MHNLSYSFRSLLYICIPLFLLSCQTGKEAARKSEREQVRFTQNDIARAQKVLGLNFTSSEIDTLYRSLESNLESYEAVRAKPLPNSVFPAMYFDPHPAGYAIPAGQEAIQWGLPEKVSLPDDEEELAFYSVAQLANLIRNRQITSLELTQLYLNRLKKHNPTLNCVVTLTEKTALTQARRADAEIVAGNYRGPLHGIPYGLKDLIAVPGYPTTWGAGPYQNQQFDQPATVAKKLEEAGAVLVAKLTSGELAYGDVWFGGRTLNPWDTSQGARGSSAGSTSATAAGLVAFSLGSETWGSIVSPSTRCGVTGLRPTYGRVSRTGVMTLSWSLDKVGPICRTAQDCALVFEAIRGSDGQDRTVVDAPFNFRANRDLRALKVGYVKDVFEKDTTTWGELNRNALQIFEQMGLQLEAVELPDLVPYNGVISTIIRGESGAVFDELLQNNQDDELARQGPGSRANSLRQSRFIPAAEYIQANRHRSLLIEDMHELFREYDLLILPTYGTDQSAISNMTGHPVVSLPNGFDERGRPVSIILMGRLYDEATVLAAAHQYQLATDFDERHPAGF